MATLNSKQLCNCSSSKSNEHALWKV